jgi:hypothetical protein
LTFIVVACNLDFVGIDLGKFVDSQNEEASSDKSPNVCDIEANIFLLQKADLLIDRD